MKNPPPHRVWKSKLAQLAWIINKAIDNGNYDLPIEEVRKAADGERVIQFIRDSLPNSPLINGDFSESRRFRERRQLL